MSDGRKKEIYRDVRLFHGAIQLQLLFSNLSITITPVKSQLQAARFWPDIRDVKRVCANLQGRAKSLLLCVMAKLRNRLASICLATQRQWCRPILARSEHKQSWQTAREEASRPRPRSSLHRQLQTAAAPVQWGEELSIKSAGTLAPQWWEVRCAFNVGRQARTTRCLQREAWKLRPLWKLQNGNGVSRRQAPPLKRPDYQRPWRATWAAALQHNQLCGRQVCTRHALPGHCVCYKNNVWQITILLVELTDLTAFAKYQCSLSW